jgi:hypothetical protein
MTTGLDPLEPTDLDHRLRAAEAVVREAGRLAESAANRAMVSLPVRKLFFVEALGHARVPFAGYQPDHRAGVELATIDAHRAAEAAANLGRRLDDGVAREARQDRFEISDLRAGLRRAIPFLLVRSRVRCARLSILWGRTRKRSYLHAYARRKGVSRGERQ